MVQITTPGEQAYSLKRLRFVNAEPVAVVTSFLPARIFSDIDKQDLERQSLYQIFERTYNRKLHWAEESIGAVVAQGDDARALQRGAGQPAPSHQRNHLR